MWNDNETISDSIDYRHLIGAVTGIIDNPALLPCSIGIFGDWGSGKSSLMGMVADHYKDDKDILVVRFNGWLFEGYEDAKTVLMAKIVDEIIVGRTFNTKAKKLAVKLLQKIDLIKAGGALAKYGLGFLAGGHFGIAAVATMDVVGKLKEIDYEKYISDKQAKEDPDKQLRANIQEFHEHFGELLAETKIARIIVFIDDLDRCSPDTVIGTLEAIKLFLFTKSTAFVIGADERLIRYAVRRRFPEIPGDATEVSRDYLEKLIQYPIRIPPLNTVELTNYVNLLFAELLTEPIKFKAARAKIMEEKQKQGFGFTFDVGNATGFLTPFTNELQESFHLSAQVVPILSVGLNGNPRQAKRFLNTMRIRQKMATARGTMLDQRNLAKMMLLEYFRPETFDSFYKLQAENGGIIPNIKAMEDAANELQDPAKTEPTVPLPAESADFVKDPWIRGWLASSPSLDKVDLGTYYYFSRDTLAVRDLRLQRMSPAAEAAFKAITGDLDAVATKALADAAGLNAGDAVAVFEAIAQKARENSKERGDKSPMVRLFKFCEKRKDLLSQLMAFLEKFPDSEFTPSVIPLLESVTKGTAYRDTAKSLVSRWSASKTNTTLAKIAKGKLNEFN
jgi:predicted KAP-like P-loop ATPase